MKKFFGLVLTLFVFGLCSLPSFSKSLTFTVITDVHIKGDKKENLMTDSISNLLKAVPDVNSSDSSFIFFLGDNIDNPSKHDLVMFSKIINRFNKPVYVALGNHDVAKGSDLDKKEYYRILNKFSKNKINKVPYFMRKDGFVFVVMDGVNQTIPGPKGYYRDEELIWLDKILTKYENDKVVILQHFPILPPVKGSTGETYDKESYFQTLAKHNNVVLIVSGHYHTEKRIEDENGIVHLSIPSLMTGSTYEQVTVEVKDGKCFVKNKILDII